MKKKDIQIGEVYKIKNGHQYKSRWFSMWQNIYVRVAGLHHPYFSDGISCWILDKNKEKLDLEYNFSAQDLKNI